MTWIEQPVEVDDEIAHVGVVDSFLRLCFPGGISSGVVRIDADKFDLVEILEFSATEIGKFATEDDVQQLFVRSGRLCGHGSIPNVNPGGVETCGWTVYANSVSRSRTRFINVSWRA